MRVIHYTWPGCWPHSRCLDSDAGGPGVASSCCPPHAPDSSAHPGQEPAVQCLASVQHILAQHLGGLLCSGIGSTTISESTFWSLRERVLEENWKRYKIGDSVVVARRFRSTI